MTAPLPDSDPVSGSAIAVPLEPPSVPAPALAEASTAAPVATPLPPPSRDPLHGVTLEMMLRELVHHQGWPTMAHRIPVRCFMFDPTITSSLRFLRKTPWARKKVEDLYRAMVTC